MTLGSTRFVWRFAIVFCLCLFVGEKTSESHVKKSTIKFIVQVEEDQLAVLMVYRPGSKSHKEALSLLGAYSGLGIDKDRLKDMMRRVIVEPLHMQLDGNPLPLHESDITWSREGRKKVVVAMLFRKKIAPTYHTLELKVLGGHQKSRFQYVDRRQNDKSPLVVRKSKRAGKQKLKLVWGNI